MRRAAEMVIKHEANEQGDALNDLWNFLVLAYSHTL